MKDLMDAFNGQPPVILDLIFDYLSVSDLANLHHAFLHKTNSTVAAYCKHTGSRRITHLITTAKYNIQALIDGERFVYKRHKWDITKYPRSRPFRPWDIFATHFERTFTGNETCPRMKITEPCIRTINDPPSRLIYDPVHIGNDSQGPVEIVTLNAKFTVEGQTTDTILEMMYDTDKCIVSDAVRDEDDGEGYYTRTISHVIPLESVSWMKQRAADKREIINGKLVTRDDTQVPSDWVEMLGKQVMTKVTFRKRHQNAVEEMQNPTGRYFIMQSFELIWDINLSETYCRPDVLNLWRNNDNDIAGKG